MIRRALILGLAALPAAASAEAIWRRDAAPATPLIEGRRTLVRPGLEGPACLDVTLKDYRKPFRLFARVQPQGGPAGWCDAQTLSCHLPGGGRLPVVMLRRDKGRLSTATKVRYCASFANRGRAPVSVWLARPPG